MLTLVVLSAIVIVIDRCRDLLISRDIPSWLSAFGTLGIYINITIWKNR